VLDEWRRTRRLRRAAEVHWVDALYSAYITAILCLVGYLFAASFVGDGPAAIDSVPEAAAWIGVVPAACVLIGLRSGSRGGPLALDAADVRVALGAPVSRAAALRSPALHQARFLLFASSIAGAAAGDLAGRRLGGNRAEWIACGALALATSTLGGFGTACLASGRRLRPSIATGAGVLLVAWALADATGGVWSPFRLVGLIALWPLGWDPAGLAPPVVVVAVLAAGVAALGGISIERLERRSRLVGQIRFAATLQDLRTVIVLRRQLTQERARTIPWLRPRLGRAGVRLPVVVRDVRSALRWPISRLVRLGVVAVVAGLSARMAFDGTTPMLVVAGLALFIGALDLAEPLGQEVDHPSRRDAVPVPVGVLYAGHVPVTAVLCVGLAAAASVVAVLVDPVDGSWAVAAACVVPAGLGAAAAGIVSVLMGAPDPASVAGGGWSMAPPEAAGMRLAFRLVWPPALATGGLAPMLLARNALDDGPTAAPVAAVLGVLPLVLFVFGLVVAWARFRSDISAWWSRQMSMAPGAGGSRG
jgi:hypothetical protein